MEAALNAALPTLAPALISRFESSEGYRAFDDVKPTRESQPMILSAKLIRKSLLVIIVKALKDRGIDTGVISNADDRMRESLRVRRALDSRSLMPSIL